MILVACKRLLRKTRERREMERMHREDLETNRRELNAVELMLSMEQRKARRLEGALGTAQKEYEEHMYKRSEGEFNRGSTSIVATLKKRTGRGGGARPIPVDSVPFTAQAQHQARKEVQGKLAESQSQVRKYKYTIKTLLEKLKTNVADERQKCND